MKEFRLARKRIDVSVGESVRLIRELQGLSRNQLAALSGISQATMVAAGFSLGEADRLRRSMAAWKRTGGLQRFEQRLVEGMRERGYSERFAQQIYKQIEGFGEYGFPRAMPRASRSWFMSPTGSSVTPPRPSRPPF